jgi:hypothetical protein
MIAGLWIVEKRLGPPEGGRYNLQSAIDNPAIVNL